MDDTIATNTHQPEPNNRVNGWRSFAIWLLVILGCLAFGAYVVVHWAERQILTTSNWVSLVGPLPKQEVVSTALGNQIGDQVFANAAVEQKITDALPPRASFLAGPLSSQLHNLTRQTAQRVVASDGFQSIWIASNRIALDRLVSTARGQTPPLQAKVNEKFNINISDVSSQLQSTLGKASAAIPALQSQSRQNITVAADLQTRADRVRQVIRTTDNLSVVLPFLASASLLSALAISTQRRRTTMAIAMSLVILMLVELVAVKALRQQVLDQVTNTANLAAVEYIYDTVVGWLRQMIIIVLLVAAAIWSIGVIAGPARWARGVKSYISVDRIKKSRVIEVWHHIRSWIKKWQRYFWLAVVLVILIGMLLFVELNGLAVLNALLLAISTIALLYIIGTPPAFTTAKLPRSAHT